MLNSLRSITPRRATRCLAVRRWLHTHNELPSTNPGTTREAWVFVDSVFPVRLGSWDLRHYIGIFREEYLLEKLESILVAVKKHGFEFHSLEPRPKDGGVFVRFTFNADEEGQALEDVLEDLKRVSQEKGGLPSWIGTNQGNIWVVKGEPWREDLNRYASPMLKIAFEGPDIRDEGLYSILRPYGRISDLSNPTPGPAGNLRTSTVIFRQVRSATIAHNCIHGLSVPSSGSSGALTRLYTTYERPIKAHAVRDWMASHPRILFPIVVFLIGSLTYTIFDPVRSVAIEGKLLGWFDFRKSKAYQWVRQNTLDRLSFTLGSPEPESESSYKGIWKERKDAEEGLRSYLADLPNTLTFIHGPQGSGKSRMLSAVLKDNQRPHLFIDCAELSKASSDSAVLLSLARQTGYWPVFPFVNSLNNLIDIASVGIIGQKAGLSASIETQMQQMLEVVGTGLKGVSSRQSKQVDKRAHDVEATQKRKTEEARRMEMIRLGVWHDGRLDCVAGNGVMSELGIGDEYMRSEDYDFISGGSEETMESEKEAVNDIPKPQKTELDILKVNTLPIVVIRNFATKRGRDEILTVLSQWAATLIDNQIAHVIVISDNRENAKQLAQALPSKPLNSIALYDADASSALSFVAQKLREAGAEEGLTTERKKSIERLGGRASDLEILVHKVRSGQTVEAAVEDIITRAVSELRKNAFGEDTEDAKTLPWTRQESWAVMKLLSKHEEIPYYDTLLDFPFKGDETALRNMEHAELIAIGTVDGRPSVIRPGRPVYRYVFERLVADSIFQAVQDIAYNEKLIAISDSTVRSCEEELMKLRDIGMESSHWWGGQSTTATRAAYLVKKMHAAASKLEALEGKNAELKKILAKGG